MSPRERVLVLLWQRGDWWDLRELAMAAGGLPPQRLRAALEEIEQSGQRLFRQAAGVRLARPAALDPCLIEHDLPTTRIGRSVLCFDKVASTNDVALAAAQQGGCDGLVVLADAQTAGRGRLGRSWISPPAANVLMSVLLAPRTGQQALPHEALTIAAGLAAAEACSEACGAACTLKWPNDVLIDGRKTAGVLVETRGGGGGAAMVIGIGVNVNAAPDDGAVDRPATCLARWAGEQIERVDLVRRLLVRLDTWIIAVGAGRVEELRRRWLACSDMVNRRVQAVSAGERHVGRVLDVSPLEGLHLCADDGRHVHLPAATTTILDMQ